MTSLRPHQLRGFGCPWNRHRRLPRVGASARRVVVGIALSLLMLAAGAGRAIAQQAETESARVLAVGHVEGGAGVEFQASSEGTESALPLFVEGGIARRLELVIEQVAYVGLRPKTGTKASGPGDLEVTLVGLALAERPRFPAIAFAAEVKAPVAQSAAIGTGEFDYAGYLILSKRLGNVDVSLNGSYTLVGKPANTMVNNIVGFAASAKYPIGKLDLFGEVLGNTAAVSGSEGTGGAAELGGVEVVGTIGAGYKLAPWAYLFLNVSYDNNQAVLIHPGVTLMHALL